MKTQPRLTTLMVMMIGLLSVGVPAQADETAGAPAAKDNAKAAPDNDTLIETWAQYGMPGEHHQLLGRMVGRWKLAVKYWMTAGSPMVESSGSCVREWALGRRFVVEEFDGGDLALPFQGMAIYGYDAFQQKYTSVWVDSLSTAVTTSAGVCRDTCDTIAFTGKHGDPWTGEVRDSRGVTRFVDKDTHVLELYEPGSDGKEFKMLEITYTRDAEQPTKSARQSNAPRPALKK
ncbi:MAG: DUF1579 domain-containing protein [bacterium]|nr:DUF1579 domain-containing protein [bacterium]